MSPSAPFTGLTSRLIAPAARSTALGLVAATLTVLLWLVFERSWIDEDAYITLRTIDQLIHGNGPRWNPDERVQTFTHPLWMVISTPLYLATGRAETTFALLGLVCTGATYLTLATRVSAYPLALIIGLFLPLVGMQAFLNYGTSGFENALTHLCYASFALAFLRSLGGGDIRWGWIAVSSSLAVTNRLDTALVFVPPIAYLLLRNFRSVRWSRFLAGFAPLLTWLAFAVFYYGFPYPNTALAKVNAEVPRSLLVTQGLYYVLHLLQHDPIAFVALCLGVALTATYAWRAWRGSDRDDPAAMAALGAGGLLQVAYVVAIGGGYLGGRHLLLPALGGLVLWSERLLTLTRSASAESGRAASLFGLCIVAVVVATGALALGPRAQAQEWVRAVAPSSARDGLRLILPGVGVARVYLDDDLRWQRSVAAQKFWDHGKRIRGPVAVSGTVGLTAIAAGRNQIIIDKNALADPLLARLPPRRYVMAGHFPREIPEGYVIARTSGSLAQMDPDLAAYYQPLREIISGPLFNAQRLVEIVRFNLGFYDAHLASYLAKQAATDLSAANSGR